MTKREQEQRCHMLNALAGLGFTPDEVDQLRLISIRLRRWHEKECGVDGGCIERDEASGKPYWHDSRSGVLTRIGDVEASEKKRLAAIMAKHAPLSAYVQTDPRGAALYILRPDDVPEGQQADAYYSRGVCVY